MMLKKYLTVDGGSAEQVNVTENGWASQFSCIILWEISMTIAPRTSNRFPLAIMQIWMWHVSLGQAWCDERGIHQHLAAPLLLLPPLALALFTHPLILDHFHTPPPSPSLPLSTPPPPCLHPSPLLLLPLLLPACLRPLFPLLAAVLL